MIRIEVKNDDDQWELLRLFEESQKDEIEACILENENYFLRAVKTGNPRKIIYTNCN